jgi:hypothetical protein
MKRSDQSEYNTNLWMYSMYNVLIVVILLLQGTKYRTEYTIQYRLSAYGNLLIERRNG